MEEDDVINGLVVEPINPATRYTDKLYVPDNM